MSRAGALTGAVVSLAVAVMPAGALAAGPDPVAASPTSGSSPPAAWARLYLRGTFSVGHRPVTVPRRGFRLEGVVTRYAPGQTIQLRVTLGGRLIRRETLRLVPIAHSGWGRFDVSSTSPASGDLVVSAVHAATPRLAGFATRRSLEVLSPWVGFGSRGPLVSLIQERLAALRLYIPQSGVYDQGTGWAIDAYHRLLGWGTSQALDGRTVRALLDGLGAFRVRFPGQGRHAEGNLSLQLLALVDGSRVEAIYPISSGKPSTPTILGEFRVYLKVPGYLPDGMYYSNFFIRGYAIHGYDPAPDYPASHGCMRLPIADAISVYRWLQLGDPVDTYY
jgi:hypothetical protein